MMRRTTTVALLTLLVLPAACKKTGDGEYQVNVPKVVTEKETVRTPTVEMKKETTMVVTPKIVVKKPPRDTTRP